MRDGGQVIGVDAGGTSSRALVVDADGIVLGRGFAGGANPNSHSPHEGAAHIAQAITEALGTRNHSDIKACVIGMAGLSRLTDPAAIEVFDRTWAELGLRQRVRMIDDTEAAFASATSSPDGTVLVAGTGSVASRIRKRKLTRTVGGYGWLLGDEGSAYWLGREAVRVTLDALAGSRSLDGLPTSVLKEALEPPFDLSTVDSSSGMDEIGAASRRELRARLIASANMVRPIQLARFAPLVSAADIAGDAAAQDITTRAAEMLITTVLAARDEGEQTPVVLIGSVLDTESPVGIKVRAGLAGLDVRSSTGGAIGAAWLAALNAYGDQVPHPVDTSGAI